MYTKYYGLTKKPFENTPDPDFLFLSKNHREVLASLAYAINTAKGFVFVVGDVGTGKTTLIHALIQQIDPSFILLNITNPRSTFKDILLYLGKEVGIASEKTGPLDIVGALQDRLEILHERDNRHAVLIIDEAHLLSDEALEGVRLISNIENEKRKLVQIILVGQNELGDKLQRDSLRPLQQRLVVTRRLVPLNKKETQEYISHRLRIAGRQSQLFDINALSLIWKKSRGVPRLINQICDNAMLIGYAVEARSIGRRIIKEVIGDMESVNKDKRHGPVFFLHRLKWPVVFAAAFLLIVYLSAGLINGKYSFSRNWSFRKNSLPVQTGTPVQPGSSLPGRNGELSAKDHFPVETEVSSRIVVTGPFSNGTEELSAEKFKVLEKERSGEEQEPLGSEQELITSTNESVPGEPQSGVGKKNNGVDLLQKRANFGGSELSKTTEEKPDDSRKWEVGNRRKVGLNECLYGLAYKEYGTKNASIVDLIQMANPNIRDVNLVYLGQEVILPQIERKNLIIKDEEGAYHIHYASFYHQESADSCIQNLNNLNQEAFVNSTRQGDNLVYRVYLGMFKDRDNAEKALDTLDLEYFSFLPEERNKTKNADTVN